MTANHRVCCGEHKRLSAGSTAFASRESPYEPRFSVFGAVTGEKCVIYFTQNTKRSCSGTTVSWEESR